MGVIGNLFINYLNFFIKRGVLGTGTIGRGGGGRTKGRVFAAEHTRTGHISESPPPRKSSRIYILTKIFSSCFIYLIN